MVFKNEAEFEENVITVLKQHGWCDGVLKYPNEQKLIDNWKRILLNNNSGIDRLNGVPLTDGEMTQIITQIKEKRTPMALNAFINGKTVSIVRDNPGDPSHLGKTVSLKIYDRKEIAGGSSVYQIAQQPVYPVRNAMLNSRRGDLCLLINGMPLIHIELKKNGIPISQATHQIEKYAHESVFTGLFRLVQVFVAMNPDDAVYFANPGTERFNPAYYFHWANFDNTPICAGKQPGADEWKQFCATLLSIPMAHQLIGFYTVADSTDGILKVMRSYQYYAVSAISDAVRRCDWGTPEPTPGRPGGYVWHTTGSGKTMTSFKSAQLIADSKDADKVVFLMDRIELGTQSLSDYKGFADNEDDVQGTEDTAELRAKLADANPGNTLIVTSIQKMSRVKVGEGNVTQAELDRLAGQRIVFIVDECHRSTFGDMLQDIRRSFPNALFFGFTGTPILGTNRKKDSTTAMIFGDELHRYTIADGIRDRNVLGFDPTMVTTYKDSDVRREVALAKAHAVTVEDALAIPAKANVFNHYMDKSEVPMAGTEKTEEGAIVTIHGIEDFVPRSQYGIDTPHPAMVVADVLEQFPVLSHGNKFHAILATSSIPEAINYYRLIKRQAPRMHVTALFDPNVDNTEGAIVKEDALVEIITDYNELFGKSFTIPTWGAMKKDISLRLAHKEAYDRIDMEREKRLDLLIVVDQMLTGFDSKWVNTLYLDKIIENESIIQAFSRTNRLFGPDKPFGIIRYYRKPHTMRSNIAAAVKLYAQDRPLELFVQKLPRNIELMDSRYQEIQDVFAAAGIKDFVQLPSSQEACRKFAKEFGELNEFLEAAKVQGFSWRQREYTFTGDDGTITTVKPNLDEHTYLILVQRYKELFDGSGPDTDPEAPYDLDGHIAEIDTGLIDADYMEANFRKWVKALNDDDSELEVVTAELHRSFATLPRNDQRLAEMFLHDVERGTATVEEGKTLREYINSYASREKDEQIEKVVQLLWVDKSLLEEFLTRKNTAANIDEFSRFDELRATVDKKHARAMFEEREQRKISQPEANRKARNLLRRFILTGGFDIDADEEDSNRAANTATEESN